MFCSQLSDSLYNFASQLNKFMNYAKGKSYQIVLAEHGKTGGRCIFDLSFLFE